MSYFEGFSFLVSQKIQSIEAFTLATLLFPEKALARRRRKARRLLRRRPRTVAELFRRRQLEWFKQNYGRLE